MKGENEIMKDGRMNTRELIGKKQSKRMKFSFFHFFILSFFILSSCSHGDFTHKAARQAAEGFYAKLVAGDYKGFVQGYAGAEQLPQDYRSQIEDATAQFLSRDEMRQLTSVRSISDSLLPDSTAYVMLQLNFSDSTSEQIELPLILTGDGWRMK